MLFSSYTFVFAFLPIVLVIYFALSRWSSKKVQHGFLVSASLCFYGWFNPYYLPIILFSIVFNYSVSSLMCSCSGQFKRKLWFAIGLIGNLALLGYFKYYDFFVENLNQLLATDYALKHMLLPLGISFFTFQQIFFLVSNYRKPEKERELIDYSLFVCFFPQLIAGPIVTYDEMMPQFRNEKNRYYNEDNFAAGLFVFAMGMFKKLAIADTVAIIADAGFDDVITLSFFQAWFTSLSYTLQIYFDFSGYCDMAVGLAKMLNINLPINFDSPYKSAGIREFWRRWHITLGRALTTLVYIPLGGNRNGPVRMYMALLLTFFISGLWHGAAWTFVLWGAAHGAFIVFERLFHDFWERRSYYLRAVLVFLFVNFMWVLFRAKSWQSAVEILKSHFSCDFGFSLNLFLPLTYNSRAELMVVLPIFLLAFICVFAANNSMTYYVKFRPSLFNAVITVLMLIVSVCFLSRVSPFIYFNF